MEIFLNIIIRIIIFIVILILFASLLFILPSYRKHKKSRIEYKWKNDKISNILDNEIRYIDYIGDWQEFHISFINGDNFIADITGLYMSGNTDFSDKKIFIYFTLFDYIKYFLMFYSYFYYLTLKMYNYEDEKQINNNKIEED